MRNDKIRRFRPRSNKYRSRRPGNGMKNNGAVQQINIHRNVVSRNGFAKNPHNLERIIEKYKNLAKEALSSGDKTLQENYLQHADHFSRILSEMEPKTKDNSNISSERKDNSNSSSESVAKTNTNTANEQN